MSMSKKQVKKLVFKALLKEGLKDKNCLPKWVNVFCADPTFYLIKTNQGNGRLTIDLDHNMTLELRTRKGLCRIVL